MKHLEYIHDLLANVVERCQQLKFRFQSIEFQMKLASSNWEMPGGVLDQTHHELREDGSLGHFGSQGPGKDLEILRGFILGFMWKARKQIDVNRLFFLKRSIMVSGLNRK